MADRIIRDRYVFDISGDEATREILKIVDALERKEDAARRAVAATGALQDESADLAKTEKQLADILAQETKTLDGAVTKLDALRKIESRLTVEQKERLGISKQLLKAESELSVQVAKQAAEQAKLKDSVNKSTSAFRKYVKVVAGAGAGLSALAGGAAVVLNRVAELDEFINATQQSIRGLSREAAEGLAGDIIGTALTFDVDQTQLLDAVKTAASEFGEDAQTVLEEINIGLIRSTTDRAREELIDQAKEYSTQFAQAGVSLREAIEVINLGDSLGVFSDKAADAVKEVGIRLGEQTTATVSAVTNAFGEDFAKQLFDDLDDGLPTFEAFKRISEELGNVDLNQQQYSQLVADIGGGALEDAGRRFFESIKSVGEGVDGVVDGLTAYQQAQAELLETNREIGRTQTAIAGELVDLSREYSNATATARLYVTQGVLRLVQVLKELPGFLRENKTEIAALFGAVALLNVNRFITGVLAINKAFKAQLVLNNLLKFSNPYTAAIAGATALIATISILTKERSNEAKLNDLIIEGTKSVSREYVAEKKELDSLFGALRDANTKGEERAAVIDEIQKRYGGYLENIDLEKAGAEELAAAYDKINESILRGIIARFQEQRAEQIVSRLAEITVEVNRLTGENVSFLDKSIAAFNRLTNPLAVVSADPVTVARLKLADEFKGLQQELTNLGTAGEQIFESLFGVIDLSFLAGTEQATKRTQQSAKQLKAAAAETKKETETLEQRLEKLGVTIDKSFVESIGRAGTESEALTLLLDGLQSQLTSLQKEAVDAADVTTLPQLEALLSQIEAQQETLTNARDLLERQAATAVEPLETLQLDIDDVPPADELPTVTVNAEAKFNPAALIEGFEQIAAASSDLVDAFVDPQLESLNRLVDEQQSVLSELESNSEDYNARQIARERNRLDTLLREQEAAADRARDIARIEVTAQLLLGVAKAIALPFPANIAAVAQTIAAAVAGFGQASAIGAGAFATGTDYLERPNGAPRGRDTIPAMLDEGEMIHSADQNRRLRSAGIRSRFDVVDYAIAWKKALSGSRMTAAANISDRMQVVGIPISGSGSNDEQKKTNRLLEQILRQQTRYVSPPPQQPNRVKA